MPEADKTNLRVQAEAWFFWWRIAATAAAILTFVWIQFVEDGVRELVREFLGINQVNERLEYIEETMAAPAVVEWLEAASRQIASCNSYSCDYALVAFRTKFGESCGPMQDISVYLRTKNGRQIRIGYKREWAPITLGRTPEEFIVPLEIPVNIEKGKYFWRSIAIYSNCAGPTEPQPRPSPWFELTITG